MKKNLRKIISLVLVLAMALAISIPAFAATKDSKVNNVTDIAIQFRNYAENYKQSYGNNSDAAQILNSFYDKRKDDSNDIINDITPKTVVSINKNQVVIFDGNLVYLKTSKIIPKKIDANISVSEVNVNNVSSTWYYTDTYSDSVSIYGNVFGNWLFTVDQDAQFRYNYSTSECIYSDGNYEFAPMNVWQVSNWQDSKITAPHHDGYNWAHVESQGHFHYGFEIQGAGLIMGNVTAWAYVECDPYGSVNHDANFNNF